MAAPLAEHGSASGPSPICAETAFISARWSIGARFTAVSRAHSRLGLFEAVQGKLAAQAVARRCQLRGSRAILNGRLFDDLGNRMTPSHTNKDGVRYRYYVSQAILQGKPQPAGLVSRVPADEVKSFVMTTLRRHLSAGEPLPK